jgi:PAS domain S-box-containing protein
VQLEPLRLQPPRSFSWTIAPVEGRSPVVTSKFLVQLTVAFVAYFVAGKLGQATTSIRSSNLGPVWPAYGVALAAFLAYGYRVWPGIALSAFVVAVQGAVSPLAAAGQAAGATVSVAASSFLLRRIAGFNPSLSRLRDALALIVVGAFGGALISSSVGIASLYASGIQPYSGLVAAWLIYWLGDSTGVLLVTPLVFAVPQLLDLRSGARLAQLTALLVLLTAACFVVFGDLSLIPIRLHALAFAVLPFVMWGAINFGTLGATLSVFLIATTATLLTALGSGPFAVNTPFVNAALLDVLFAVLSVTGLSLAAVIAERKRAESERERLIREQAEMRARLRLAAVVESSEDAIVSQDLSGIVLSWNRAASRLFGFKEKEAVGQPIAKLMPPELRLDPDTLARRERMTRFETTRVTAAGEIIFLVSTVSPLVDATGEVVGVVQIIRDVSDHKRAEEVSAGVNRRLIEAQEEERARIARELHDDIGQRLAVLTWSLAGFGQDLQKQASDIAADVQALSRDLHPSRIEMLGIATGVGVFCREFAEQKTVEVDFVAGEIPGQLPSAISHSLFRIVQEALHNSAKHSGVRRFEVRLWAADGWIHLLVRDHGTGFDVEGSRTGGGLGLITMKERIKLVHGELTIESQPGLGTTVHARVPFTPSQAVAVH